jgi:hypothetical protein
MDNLSAVQLKQVVHDEDVACMYPTKILLIHFLWLFFLDLIYVKNELYKTISISNVNQHFNRHVPANHVVLVL